MKPDPFAGSPQEGFGGPRSRRKLLAVGSAAAAALLLEKLHTAVAATGGPSQAQDRQIFRFALQLEALQAAFYTDALTRAKLRGELREFAEVVAGHESQHVAAVAKAASEVVPSARFDFRGATSDAGAFAKAARELEDLGVSAYNGQLANLTDEAMGLAASIASVEGRHAAWIRDLVGLPPAPRPVDPGEEASRVGAALTSLGFRRKR
jgi:rubrerythrin